MADEGKVEQKKTTEQSSEKKVIGYEKHPDKDATIADLQNNRTKNPFSEKSKQMIHNLQNVECFELCEISPKSQCHYYLKCWTEGIVYCICVPV